MFPCNETYVDSITAPKCNFANDTFNITHIAEQNLGHINQHLLLQVLLEISKKGDAPMKKERKCNYLVLVLERDLQQSIILRGNSPMRFRWRQACRPTRREAGDHRNS